MQDADALFAHLQELVDAMPRMQEQGTRLDRARAAAEVARCAHEAHTCTVMLEEADRELEAARTQRDAAREAGAPHEEIDRLDHAFIYLSGQRSLRVGPHQNTQAALEQALHAGGFANEDEAAAAALSAEELAALEQEITAYQQDYAATLASCQAVEGAE